MILVEQVPNFSLHFSRMVIPLAGARIYTVASLIERAVPRASLSQRQILNTYEKLECCRREA